MERFLCIHGHFYQPPRENPWIESVELQDSAAPYHDWNERVTAECYAPNATARILDGDGRIEQIVNNYSKISFNFGPTLLTWLKDKMPAIHDAIVEADVRSRERFSGHGSAIAQVYNHMIMPFASERDKRTQVIWGIRDFEARFGRAPEGMWLAETAADTETFEVLAEHGIKFTILSPFQAARFREIGTEHWHECNGGGIDPSRAYLTRLPSGRELNLFFYDAPVSQAVAFEKLLTSGERFAQRIEQAYSDQRDWNQLVHIATDGESYGHHHQFGEMALAFALQHIETKNLARLTNYGEFLEKNPPRHEAQIYEKSAWSCSHGIGRWAEHCGCNTGGRNEWTQNWRGPLRQSLNWLRDELAPMFEKAAGQFLKDPWRARDNYIHAILDRSQESLEKFFSENASRQLTDEEKTSALKLLEVQRHALLMFTSCGWFFDEISGIETVQIIQYAGRAIQLTREVFGRDLEPEFLDLLEHAKSNIADHRDGRMIYEKFVKPAMVDFEKVVAHYAISSVFESYSSQTKIFTFRFEDVFRDIDLAGRAKLAIGTVKTIFDITRESTVLSYAVVYFGEHNLIGGVKQFESPEAFKVVADDLKESFRRADFLETLRRLDACFPEATYSLKSLFKDEQRKILEMILVSTRQDIEDHFRNIVGRYTPLVRFLQGLNAPLLPGMRAASDFILHTDLCRLFASDTPNFDQLRSLIEQAQSQDVKAFDSELAFTIKMQMESMIERLSGQPEDLALLRNLRMMAEISLPLPLSLNLWKVQNTYWKMLQEIFPDFKKMADEGNEPARDWLGNFKTLGDHLKFAPWKVQQSEQKSAA